MAEKPRTGSRRRRVGVERRTEQCGTAASLLDPREEGVFFLELGPLRVFKLSKKCPTANGSRWATASRHFLLALEVMIAISSVFWR